MKFRDHHRTWNERKEMDHSKEQENEKFETRSVTQVDICSCCGKEMTPVEVVESYLDQRIEQALEVCGGSVRSMATQVSFNCWAR